MLVGEAEIQGQIKRAYDAALERETAGPLTNHLFKAALATGKRVRTETAIGERPAQPARRRRWRSPSERLGELAGREVVIIGTGETGELTARALADSGAAPVFVANRRRDRAISLARRYGGTSVALRRAARGAAAGRHRRRRDRLAAPPARGRARSRRS